MKLPLLSIICAMDESRGIGKNDRIPWHIRKDLVRLRDMTKDNYVVIGRNSYDSMAGYYDKSGRPMPAKEYIVLTKNKNFKSLRNNTHTVTSIDDLLNYVKKIKTPEVFIIGGATIYEQLIKYTDKLYLTVVKGNFDCDTFFPDYSDFKNEVHSEMDSDEGLDFTFKILEK
jgi:dihydrofolate reductase